MPKMLIALTLTLLASSAFAQDFEMPEYQNESACKLALQKEMNARSLYQRLASQSKNDRAEGRIEGMNSLQLNEQDMELQTALQDLNAKRMVADDACG